MGIQDESMGFWDGLWDSGMNPTPLVVPERRIRIRGNLPAPPGAATAERNWVKKVPNWGFLGGKVGFGKGQQLWGEFEGWDLGGGNWGNFLGRESWGGENCGRENWGDFFGR